MSCACHHNSRASEATRVRGIIRDDTKSQGDFEGKARQERYETSKDLFQCKMSEGTPVGAHVIKMMGYIQTLEKLGLALNNELVTDIILQSLSDNLKQFILISL
ncbi:hypothetical protein V6N13_126601 [Hibiscus sabdariffa]